MTTTTDYEKQAKDFLNDTNSELTIKFFKYDHHFEGDKDKRDIYDVTLKRGNREYCFKFGNCLANSGYFLNNKRQLLPSDQVIITEKRRIGSKQVKNRPSQHLEWKGCPIHETVTVKEPTAYTVLSCLEKYDPGTFEDFCDNFGYDTDSKNAERTYKAVTVEYKALQTLYNDKELEQLTEVA